MAVKVFEEVWALSSYRAGENRQILGLAKRLGLPWLVKRVRYRRNAGLLGLMRRSTLAGIERARSDPLEPPWPGLLISAGLRNEPVARWIREQSGGRTRLVFLGRTWMRGDQLDLLITTPQYRIRRQTGVQHNLLTMHDVTPEQLGAARRDWETRLEYLPRPRVGVLIGGGTGPYTLGTHSAKRLARALNAQRTERGGSILATTSARTPDVVADVLAREIHSPALVHRWRPDDDDNPYLGILACADELVVTGDSVAMLSEAAATGSPVRVFPLPEAGDEEGHLRARLYSLLMRWAPQRASRDVGLFHDAYVAAGYGTMLGAPSAPTPFGPESRSGRPQRETACTIERVLDLLDEEPPLPQVPAACLDSDQPSRTLA